DGNANGETVKVKYAGREQIFAGVTKIVGNLGKGDDQVFVRSGIRVPVELYGEGGNDVLVYEGSNTATLDGGGGFDYLETGTATLNVIMRGGSGADFLRYNGAGVANMDGGADSDKIYGGAGADTITGGTGDDEIDGRGGDDSIDAGAGNDVIYWTIE